MAAGVKEVEMILCPGLRHEILNEPSAPQAVDEPILRWLEAQIDYTNGEYEKYNNSIEMFNTAWTEYQNYYNRNHMPLGKKMNYFGDPKRTAEYQAANSVAKVTIKEG